MPGQNNPPGAQPEGNNSNGGPQRPSPDLQKFFQLVLKLMGAPANSANMAFLNAWARREGAGGGYNPLNTTLGMPGATSMNGVGVKNYKNWREGARATAKTLMGGNYADLVSAFKAGNISTEVQYPGLETWSGHGYGSLSGVPTKPYVLYAGPNGTNPLDGTPGESIPLGRNTERTLAMQDGQQPVLSKADLAGGLSKDGFAIGLIDSHPELKSVFSEALTKNWSVDRALLAIQNTSWFQNHSASQRQYEELLHSDPGQLQRKIDQQVADLRQMETSFGIHVDDVNGLATAIIRNGMDPQEQQQAIAHAFRYKGQTLSGQVGTDVDNLKQLSEQYYVGLTNKQLTNMSQRMLIGQLDPSAVTDYFKNAALSKFPHLKQQINDGHTVEDIANPYKVEMAKYWHDDPDFANNIKNQDPMIMKALQQNTPEGSQLMPIWQFQQQLKSDPRWLKTDNARDSMMDSATGLLQDMGLISGGSNVGAFQSQALG